MTLRIRSTQPQETKWGELISLLNGWRSAPRLRFPLQWKPLQGILQLQLFPLRPIQDRLDALRREQSQPEDLTDVGFPDPPVLGRFGEAYASRRRRDLIQVDHRVPIRLETAAASRPHTRRGGDGGGGVTANSGLMHI